MTEGPTTATANGPGGGEDEPLAAVSATGSPLGAARSAYAALRTWASPLEHIAQRRDLARLVLEDAGGPESQVHALATALTVHTERLVGALGPPPRSDTEAITGEDGVLLWDACVAALFDAYGETGEDSAARWLEGARERWDAHGPHGQGGHDAPDLVHLWDGFLRLVEGIAPEVIYCLAWVVWHDVRRPEVEEGRSLICPAVPRGVRNELSLWRQGGQRRALPGGGFELVNKNERTVAAFPALPETNLALLRRGVDAGHALLRERVVRTLIIDVYRQAVSGLVNPFNRLVYRGGWVSFAESARIKKDTDRAALEAVFEALQAYRGGRRDLPAALSFWYRRGSGSRDGDTSGELRVDVLEALWSGYVKRMPSGPARHLLPVLPLPNLAFAGPTNHAALADLQWWVLAEMRERAKDLAGTGAVDIVDRITVLADRVGLRPARVRDALVAWSDPRDPEAWLTQDDRGGYAPRDLGARALLLDAVGQAEEHVDRIRNRRRK